MRILKRLIIIYLLITKIDKIMFIPSGSLIRVLMAV